MDFLAESNLTVDQKRAVEIVASTPGISQRKLALEINRNLMTVNSWFQNPTFTDACFDRFKELSGVKLTMVIEAMFREASEGNVAAARLLLEHHNKLDRTLHIKVESPFDKFLNSKSLDHIDVEDAEIIGRSVEITSDLPPRNPEANQHYRKITEGKKVKSKIRTTKQKIKKNNNQNARYHLRKRAKVVELQMLPPGKPKEEKRRAWMRELKKREEFMGIIYPD